MIMRRVPVSVAAGCSDGLSCQPVQAAALGHCSLYDRPDLAARLPVSLRLRLRLRQLHGRTRLFRKCVVT